MPDVARLPAAALSAAASAVLGWLQRIGSDLFRLAGRLGQALGLWSAIWWIGLLQGLLVALLLLLGVLLLRRLPDLLPAVALLLARLWELLSRLGALGLALLRQLVWIDPARRRARHARRSRRADGAASLGLRILAAGLDLLLLPWDWLAGLGLQRLLGPEPRCEEKEERRRPASPGLAQRLGWVLERHANILLALSVLRLLLPRWWVPGPLWRRMVHPGSYAPDFPIRGMLWLSLAADVREVLGRPEAFEVIYGPRMRLATRPLAAGAAADGEEPGERGNFLLGMQDTPRYWRDSSNMRLVFRREDADRCRRLAGCAAEAALQRALAGAAAEPADRGLLRLDLPAALVIPVAEALVNDYFGLPVPLHVRHPVAGDPGPGFEPGLLEVDQGHRWLEALFRALFYDLRGDDSLAAAARCGPRVAAALRAAIRRRREAMAAGASPQAEDVLSRCLRLQSAGTPGMDDETLRINLTGFLVGAMTPLINATCQVMDVLLEQPQALAGAREAARRHDHAALRACVIEALRFSPGDPVIYRWTRQDTWLGAGSRRCRLPAGTLVMAWNASAMFDAAMVAEPWRFRADRPSGAYLHWGHGQHSCAGAYINEAVIPAMLAPLLSRTRIARAPGAAGQPSRERPGGITIRRFELLVSPEPPEAAGSGHGAVPATGPAAAPA